MRFAFLVLTLSFFVLNSNFAQKYHLHFHHVKDSVKTVTTTTSMDLKGQHPQMPGKVHSLIMKEEVSYQETVLAVSDKQRSKIRRKYTKCARQISFMGRENNMPLPIQGQEVTYTVKDGNVDKITKSGKLGPEDKDKLNDELDTELFFPKNPVAINEEVKLTEQQVKALFDIDEEKKLKKGNATLKLIKVADEKGVKTAQVSITGSVDFLDKEGMPVTVTATYNIYIDLAKNLPSSVVIDGSMDGVFPNGMKVKGPVKASISFSYGK